ncbi:MAG: RNA-binding protein [Proteobacteria bacterium]|nr:RNA-binding protein [Pseudomonadota bacterium]MBI3499030.1 RNA-binding protein [Pseudomonadota bacterium]
MPAASEAAEAPRRRCIASGRTADKADLIRFVVGPDARVVPDLDGKLPGRGVYVAPERALVERAVARGLFAKAAHTRVKAEADLADQVTAGLVRRMVEAIGLARRAGQAVCGFERVRERLAGGAAGLMIEASDGAAGGRGKLSGLAQGVPVMDGLTAAELGGAFGRDAVVHAVVDRGKLAGRLLALQGHLAGFRSKAEAASSRDRG